MTVREFWYDEPDLLWAYRKSYMEKIKLEEERINYTAWLNGAYIFEGVSSAIYNSFGRKNGAVAMEYPNKPYDLTVKSEEERKKEKQKEVEDKIKERLRRAKTLIDKNKVGEK